MLNPKGVEVNWKKVVFNVFLVAVGLLAVNGLAEANLVSDGNFTLAPDPGTFTTYGPGYSAGSTFGGWTVTAGSIDLIGTYWQAPPNGGRSVDMDGDYQAGTIVGKSFTTIPGQTYALTFYLAGNPDGGPTTKILDVSVGNVSGDVFTFNDTGFDKSNMGWTREQLIFTATSGLTTLTFYSGDATDNAFGAVIGNVDVSAVPEPATLLLLGAGLVGLGLSRRKKA